MVVEMVDMDTVEKAIVAGLVALGAGYTVYRVAGIKGAPIAIGVIAGLTYLITEADINQLSLKDAITTAVIVGFTSWLADYITNKWT